MSGPKAASANIGQIRRSYGREALAPVLRCHARVTITPSNSSLRGCIRFRRLADPKAAPSIIPLPSGVFQFPSASISAPAAPTGPVAPAEAIPVEIKAIEQAFVAAGNARFLDLGGRFTFDDRTRITNGVNDLAAKTGAKVYVLALPGKTDPNSFAAIHSDLKLQPRDVLFVFSAEKRHLHSQAIPKSVGSEILKDTNKDFYKSQTEGVLKMFDAIAARLTSAAQTSTAAPATSAPVQTPRARTIIQGEWVLLAVAAVVIAWALLRTSKKAPPKKAAPKSEPR